MNLFPCSSDRLFVYNPFSVTVALALVFSFCSSNYFICRIKLKCIILQKFISGLNDILWIFDKLRMQTIKRKVQTSAPSVRNAVTLSFLSRGLHNWFLNLSFFHNILTKRLIMTNIAKYWLQVNKHWTINQVWNNALTDFYLPNIFSDSVNS